MMFKSKELAHRDYRGWAYEQTCTNNQYHSWYFNKLLHNKKPEYKCATCGAYDYPEGEM